MGSENDSGGALCREEQANLFDDDVGVDEFTDTIGKFYRNVKDERIWSLHSQGDD